MIVHDCGDRALLVEYSDLAETMSYYRTLRDTVIDDVEDLVPAARTVLVRHSGGRDRVHAWISAAEPDATAASDESDPVVIEVDYSGEDLDEVARLTGMTVSEVVSSHTSQLWTVAFGGFAPGFGYLVGDDDRLHVPRRAEPRTSVPAGSVGLAGEFSGIYPRSSPGGWQLIGRTDAVLWDPQRDPPALLRPGVAIKFESA